MVAIKRFSRSGFRLLVIFFLGLNVAWLELAYNTVITQGKSTLLGWPPFGWYMTAHEWFWIHFALTGLSIAVLLYLDDLWYRGDDS